MKNLFTKCRCIKLVLLLSSFLFTGLSQADVSIQLSAQECTVSVSIAANGCDADQCSGDSTCVCASKGEHIKWDFSGDDKFKLKFSGDSPLKDNCGKNFKKKKHKCVVKDDTSKGQSYSYDIRLKSCANGTDPRIVIK